MQNNQVKEMVFLIVHARVPIPRKGPIRLRLLEIMTKLAVTTHCRFRHHYPKIPPQRRYPDRPPLMVKGTLLVVKSKRTSNRKAGSPSTIVVCLLRQFCKKTNTYRKITCKFFTSILRTTRAAKRTSPLYADTSLHGGQTHEQPDGQQTHCHDNCRHNLPYDCRRFVLRCNFCLVR